MSRAIKPLIKFSYQYAFSFSNRTALKKTVLKVFAAEKKPLSSITYVFCDDDFLLNLNRQFLQHDTLTDVITFDLSSEIAVIGEVYISIPRVRENAVSFHSTFQRELNRVIFHAALHLCGYKDKTKLQKATMRAKENYYLG